MTLEILAPWAPGQTKRQQHLKRWTHWWYRINFHVRVDTAPKAATAQMKHLTERITTTDLLCLHGGLYGTYPSPNGVYKVAHSSHGCIDSVK